MLLLLLEHRLLNKSGSRGLSFLKLGGQRHNRLQTPPYFSLPYSPQCSLSIFFLCFQSELMAEAARRKQRKRKLKLTHKHTTKSLILDPHRPPKQNENASVRRLQTRKPLFWGSIRFIWRGAPLLFLVFFLSGRHIMWIDNKNVGKTSRRIWRWRDG